MANEPDGEVLPAVEVEAGEAVGRELVGVVAQALGVVEDDDRDDANSLASDGPRA